MLYRVEYCMDRSINPSPRTKVLATETFPAETDEEAGTLVKSGFRRNGKRFRYFKRPPHRIVRIDQPELVTVIADDS